MPKDYATAATIVSLFPLPVFERKPLIPSLYQVAASKAELKPEILVVHEGIFHVYLDEFRGMMTIRNASYYSGRVDRQRFYGQSVYGRR